MYALDHPNKNNLTVIPSCLKKFGILIVFKIIALFYIVLFNKHIDVKSNNNVT